jgi:hypothetical protein
VLPGSAVTIALLVMAALPHSFVRGRAPRGKTQYYVCGKKSCSEYTTSYDPDYPEYCQTHDKKMDKPVYRK